MVFPTLSLGWWCLAPFPTSSSSFWVVGWCFPSSAHSSLHGLGSAAFSLCLPFLPLVVVLPLPSFSLWAVNCYLSPLGWCCSLFLQWEVLLSPSPLLGGRAFRPILFVGGFPHPSLGWWCLLPIFLLSGGAFLQFSFVLVPSFFPRGEKGQISKVRKVLKDKIGARCPVMFSQETQTNSKHIKLHTKSQNLLKTQIQDLKQQSLVCSVFPLCHLFFLSSRPVCLFKTSRVENDGTFWIYTLVVRNLYTGCHDTKRNKVFFF